MRRQAREQACVPTSGSSFVRAVANGAAVFQFAVCIDDLISVDA